MYLYKIECDIDKKVYAGITNNVKRRWKEHRSELRGNRHHNSHLQCAWNKYGENVFKFVLINEFNSLDTMNKAEIDYIDEFNLLNPDKGYNLASGGCAFEHGLEARKKIAESNEISVISKCLKTGEEKIYNKILDVKLDGLNVKSIANPCTGRALTYKGRVWMYLKDYNKDPDELGRRFNSYQNTKARPTRFRSVQGVSLVDGSVVEYKPCFDSKKDGFNPSHILQCCNSKRKTHKKYIWNFKE